MGLFSKLLPAIAGLGVGLVAPELLPAVFGGAAAAGGAAAGGAAAGAFPAALTTSGMAELPGMSAAATAASAAPAADGFGTALGKAADWLGNHPESAALGLGLLAKPNAPPPSTGGLTSPGQPYQAPQAQQRPPGGPQDFGFNNAVINSLRR